MHIPLEEQLPGLLLLIPYQLNTDSGTTKMVRKSEPYLQPSATWEQVRKGDLDKGCRDTADAGKTSVPSKPTSFLSVLRLSN